MTTALQRAIESMRISDITFALSQKDINGVDLEGHTPLTQYIQKNDLPIVKFVLCLKIPK